MKKIQFALLSGLAAFAFCACSTAVAEDEKKYYVFATPLISHPIWEEAREGFFDACEELNVHGDWLGPGIIDTTQMENVIRTAILQKADGIITQGVVDKHVLLEAKNSGIPVILVDSDMDPESRLCFLGKDFHRQAHMFLEDIEKRLGPDEPLRIAIQAANLGFSVGQEQVEEVREVFAAHPGGFEIVSTSQSLSDEVRSHKEWEEVLSSDPTINVAISFAGEAGVRCYDAASALGIEDRLLIYGVDRMQETLDYVREGRLTGSLITSFYQYGYQGMKIMQRYEQEHSAPSIESVDLQLVTQENIDEILDQSSER